MDILTKFTFKKTIKISFKISQKYTKNKLSTLQCTVKQYIL